MQFFVGFTLCLHQQLIEQNFNFLIFNCIFSQIIVLMTQATPLTSSTRRKNSSGMPVPPPAEPQPQNPYDFYFIASPAFQFRFQCPHQPPFMNHMLPTAMVCVDTFVTISCLIQHNFNDYNCQTQNIP